MFVGGWYLYTYQRPIFDEIYNTILGKKDNETPGEPDKPPVIVDGELSIHFLELGNNYSGDCIYIKAGDTDILVDAGSRAGSVDTIQTYLKDYVKDDILEYVVVTHADQDHIAGFGASKSIFDLYECKTTHPETDGRAAMERVSACAGIRTFPIDDFQYFQPKHDALHLDAGEHLQSLRHHACTILLC